MSFLLLTKNSTFIIGPVSTVLGYIMEGIFWLLAKIGIPNIGLAIILFTVVIYLLLLPLTIKQQKFSKLQAKMNPEIQAITAKYKNKRDVESSQAMQDETKAVYAKYGVSPTGSCVQLLIQMPILFALYRVIYSMPAYVGQIKSVFTNLVTQLVAKDGSSDFIQTFKSAGMFAKQFKSELFLSGDVTTVSDTFIDVLNRASLNEWASISEKYPDLASTVDKTLQTLEKYNTFLFVNVAETPWDVIQRAWPDKQILVIIGALVIPALAGLSQWVSMKLQPGAQNQNSNGEENTMMSSMKMMNNIMPLMSVFFCFTFPSGMGLYWIVGAVVRCIQQICINKYIDRMDIDELIKKNTEKYNEKLKKRGVLAQGINNSAKLNTKTVTSTKPSITKDADSVKKSTEYYNKNSDSKQGSLASKANMVKQYNEKNNKDNK